ncbi:MAG: hypothetical protein KIT20_08430 [Alphaproteobacteria bacterium]|nr:hypothetical protein [Alphaproteobacteria bacterium]
MGGADDRRPGASPACYLDEADAAYAGYLPAGELAGFLNRLLEGERAGAKVGAKMRNEASGETARALLADVARDEARYVAVLSGLLRRLGQEPSEATGAFRDKALRIEGEAARIAFLNRGQQAVIRMIEETLPRIREDFVHAALSEMLARHRENVARCAEFLERGG